MILRRLEGRSASEYSAFNPLFKHTVLFRTDGQSNSVPLSPSQSQNARVPQLLNLGKIIVSHVEAGDDKVNKPLD